MSEYIYDNGIVVAISVVRAIRPVLFMKGGISILFAVHSIHRYPDVWMNGANKCGYSLMVLRVVFLALSLIRPTTHGTLSTPF